MTINALTFVYDADGSVVGELRYWFGTLVGAEHCSLCDLTHSRWGKRRDFTEFADGLDLPIEFHHRDDVPAHVRSVASSWPCVVGHDGATAHLLLGPDELAGFGGNLGAFEAALGGALARTPSG